MFLCIVFFKTNIFLILLKIDNLYTLDRPIWANNIWSNRYTDITDIQVMPYTLSISANIYIYKKKKGFKEDNAERDDRLICKYQNFQWRLLF